MSVCLQFFWGRLCLQMDKIVSHSLRSRGRNKMALYTGICHDRGVLSIESGGPDRAEK
jgi:hypothetical protein